MVPTKSKYKRAVTDIHALFFINSENEKITVFSHYTQIIKEFEKLGIVTREATVKELLSKLSQLIFDEYIRRLDKEEEYSTAQFYKTDFYKRHATLLYHVKEVAYNMYDYNLNKMPDAIQYWYKIRVDSKDNRKN